MGQQELTITVPYSVYKSIPNYGNMGDGRRTSQEELLVMFGRFTGTLSYIINI